ncbi:MAG: hypothetical protein U0807_12915 [Candidatus Binatia bacterium]
MLRLATLILFAVVTTGCPPPATLSTGYRVDPVALRPTPHAGRLAVRTLAEGRPHRVYTTSGHLFLTYVPLLPYVTAEFERLDESVRLNADAMAARGQTRNAVVAMPAAPPYGEYAFPASFARAIADDLAGTGIFEGVEFVGDGPTDGFAYELSGTLLETPLYQTSTSFGLGAAGVMLWLLPVPMSKTSAVVSADLALTEKATGAVVWTERIHGAVSRVIMLYTSQGIVYGPNVLSYSHVYPPADAGVDRVSVFGWHFAALRAAMAPVKTKIAQALATR